MNDKNNGQGQFEYIEVSNSPTDGRTLNRRNTYHIEFINNTAFEIIVLDRDSGSIRIPANDSIRFIGHPGAAVEIRYKIRFNVAAPTTDFLIILISQINSYGNIK
jgi:DNA-dependent RNA polymerase auxiliary subunit epsilon|tara:strand:+ start:8052 stop:8366 length:315 start_codon:yes stop_codon:yes gene_type:complete